MIKNIVLLGAVSAFCFSGSVLADPLGINPPSQIYCSNPDGGLGSAKCVWNSTNLLWQKATWAYSHYPLQTETYYFVGAEYLIDGNGDPIADSAIYRRKDANGNMVGSDYVALGLIEDGTVVPDLTQTGSLWAKSKTGRLGVIIAAGLVVIARDKQLR